MATGLQLLPATIISIHKNSSADNNMATQTYAACIVSGVGLSFTIGCIIGSFGHMVRGFVYSPARERTRGAFRAMRFGGPKLGGVCALYALFYHTTNCILQAVHQEYSYIGSIAASFVAGTMASSPNGMEVACRVGLMSALIMAVSERMSYVRTLNKQNREIGVIIAKCLLRNERFRRKSAGLPDFTPNELKNLKARVKKGEDLVFEEPSTGSR